jgi:hypothetical protein
MFDLRDMAAFTAKTKTGTGTRPVASIVSHCVGVAFAPNNVISKNLGQLWGSKTVIDNHILTNTVESHIIRHFNPMLA